VKGSEVTAGLAKINGSLLSGIWRDSLHVTCGLTACTPGSAPGPTLGNEYGKTLPFTFYLRYCNIDDPAHLWRTGTRPQFYTASRRVAHIDGDDTAKPSQAEMSLAGWLAVSHAHTVDLRRQIFRQTGHRHLPCSGHRSAPLADRKSIPQRHLGLASCSVFYLLIYFTNSQPSVL